MLMSKNQSLEGQFHRVFTAKHQAICSGATADSATGPNVSWPTGESNAKCPGHVRSTDATNTQFACEEATRG